LEVVGVGLRRRIDVTWQRDRLWILNRNAFGASSMTDMGALLCVI
jgi:hypothetical protein